MKLLFANVSWRAGLGVLLVLSLGGIASLEALFAPKSELWPRWRAHDAASTRTIDHAPWERLLMGYLVTDSTGLNRFDYRRVSKPDRAALGAYLNTLSRTPISNYNRREQLAYWINFYNALTVQVVLDHYPVDSIRDIDISPGLFSDGPWGKALATVESEELSLNDIEHRIIRPIWRDARIHYAVNCAAVGCPSLRKSAFTGATLDAMLDAGAAAYVNSPHGVRLDGDKLIVSSIFVWFGEDFGESDADVIAHLKRYAESSLKTSLDKKTEIDGHRYDWSLNRALDDAS